LMCTDLKQAKLWGRDGRASPTAVVKKKYQGASSENGDSIGEVRGSYYGKYRDSFTPMRYGDPQKYIALK
jgi:hypothetical protein